MGSFYTLDEYFGWISTSDISTFGVILNIYFILNAFIHNLCLKLLMFITANELLCSIVITLSN